MNEILSVLNYLNILRLQIHLDVKFRMNLFVAIKDSTNFYISLNCL